MNFMFFVNSVLLGIGLAMDAFSVSIANALNENKMRVSRMCLIAGIYAFFQFAMPLIGWICVHTIVIYFSKLQIFIPYIALILLSYIGGKMIFESITNKEETESTKTLFFSTLILQGIATSIDALSVGFTIAEYKLLAALISCSIIALVTFAICITGLIIGKKVGEKLSNKAEIVGGIILILIGIEIFLKSGALKSI